MFIRNAWYVAAWADEIAGTPMARRICNEPVVLYRDAEGHAAALLKSGGLGLSGGFLRLRLLGGCLSLRGSNRSFRLIGQLNAGRGRSDAGGN